ncbi:MAG: hypothetical protein A2X18_01730 [Bacteroidetes bacterium GWF2_40_14]|nr:MAG: hypothetical protein A2X18_01730 [Bacteroidetes bacterium GWF2_40_14]
MKKLLLILLLCSTSIVYSQGIVFEEGKFIEVTEIAKKTGKIVFIDFYTDWCGPCRNMVQNIFPIKEVGSFYNSNFINYKINAEKGEGIELAKRYSVSAYPTYFFINEKGDVIYKFMGARDQEGIIKEGNKALLLKSNIEKISLMEKVCKNHKNDTNFLKEYVDLLIESGREAGEPLNNYILLMDNDAMQDLNNIRYFENISLYSPAVMDKMIATLSYLYGIDPKSGLFAKLNKASVKSLSTLLRNSGKKSTVDELESLLVIKSKFTDFGNKDNITLASMGSGIALMPADELRLSYYKAHKMVIEYSLLFERYIDNYIALNSAEKIEKENMNLEIMLDDGMKKLAESGKSKEEIENSKKMFGMVNVFRTVNFRYYSTYILNGYTDYLTYNNNSIEAITKVSGWIEYSYLTCKQYDIAETAANILIKLNYPAKARIIIEDFLKNNTNNKSITPEQMETIRNILYSLL